MYNVSETQEIPGLGPPRNWPVARASTVLIPNITVLKLGLEVLHPGPVGSRKGLGALESLPLVAPSCLLSVSAAEQNFLTTLAWPRKE